MAIYTLSMNYIDGVGGNQSHLYNVFLKFSNPECEHKAAMDKSKKLLLKYAEAARNNNDLQTWLGWMSNKQESHFEVIDVNIPDDISDEEMYLMIAAATKPYKKVIVGSHQCWQHYEYFNGCNKIIYNSNEIIVLDKEEAILELKDKSFQNVLITQTMDKKNNPWHSGSFYLFAFLAVLAALVVSAFYLPAYAIPLVIIAALLALSVLGAFQLRNDDRLSDKSFLSLMGMSLKQLPFLRKSNPEDPKEK